jgi:hypothetical protein
VSRANKEIIVSIDLARINEAIRTGTLCSDLCPEGCHCALSGRHAHRLHICSNPDCKCHSQSRYEPNRVIEPTDQV